MWTDLWVITLWKEVCVLLITNEHIPPLLFFFPSRYEKWHAEIHLFITSVNQFWWRRAFLLLFSLGRLLCVYMHMYVDFPPLYLFIYFSPQNLQWARDVLLGSSISWQQLKHMPAQGLFCERNKTNLFNVSPSLTPHACFSSMSSCHHTLLHTFWRLMSSLDLLALHYSNSRKWWRSCFKSCDVKKVVDVWLEGQCCLKTFAWWWKFSSGNTYLIN